MAEPELTAWCERHGVKLSGIQAAFVQEGWRGIVATRDLRPDQVVLRVPERLLLTTRSAQRDALLMAAVASIQGASETRSDSGAGTRVACSSSSGGRSGRLTPQQLLASHLLHEVSRGDGSFWWPYLKQLPRSYTSLANFAPEDAEALQLRSAVEVAQAAAEAAREEWRSALPVLQRLGLPKRFTGLRAWLWAASTLHSRTMYLPWCPAGALTPYGDLHNYQPPPAPFTPQLGVADVAAVAATTGTTARPRSSVTATTAVRTPAAAPAGSASAPQAAPSLALTADAAGDASAAQGTGAASSGEANQAPLGQGLRCSGGHGEGGGCSGSSCMGVDKRRQCSASDDPGASPTAAGQPGSGGCLPASPGSEAQDLLPSAEQPPPAPQGTTGSAGSDGRRASPGAAQLPAASPTERSGPDPEDPNNVELALGCSSTTRGGDGVGETGGVARTQRASRSPSHSVPGCTAAVCSRHGTPERVGSGTEGDGGAGKGSESGAGAAAWHEGEGEAASSCDSIAGDGLWDEDGQQYCILVRRPYRRGEQVFLCYGRHTNLELLEHYGFVLQDNPHDTALLDSELLPLPPAAVAAAAAHGLQPPASECCLHANGQPGWQLLRFLRFCAATPAERRSCGHLMAAGERVSEQGDLQVLRWLHQACSRQLGAMGTTLEQDEQELTRTSQQQDQDSSGSAAESPHTRAHAQAQARRQEQQEPDPATEALHARAHAHGRGEPCQRQPHPSQSEHEEREQGPADLSVGEAPSCGVARAATAEAAAAPEAAAEAAAEGSQALSKAAPRAAALSDGLTCGGLALRWRMLQKRILLRAMRLAEAALGRELAAGGGAGRGHDLGELLRRQRQRLHQAALQDS